MNSAAKEYGGKMLDAVLKDLPEEWNVVVAMDCSVLSYYYQRYRTQKDI